MTQATVTMELRHRVETTNLRAVQEDDLRQAATSRQEQGEDRTESRRHLIVTAAIVKSGWRNRHRTTKMASTLSKVTCLGPERRDPVLKTRSGSRAERRGSRSGSLSQR